MASKDDTLWVHDLFRDVDAMDRERIGPWLSPDYETQLGNNPPVRGKEMALNNSARFWKTIRSMRHEIHDIIIEGNRAASLAIVTYTRLDGREVSIPVASIIRRSGERQIDRLHIYMDLSPLFHE